MGLIGVDQYHAHRFVLGIRQDYFQSLRHPLGKAGSFLVFNGHGKLVDLAVLIEAEPLWQGKREVAENVVGGERRVELVA